MPGRQGLQQNKFTKSQQVRPVKNLSCTRLLAQAHKASTRDSSPYSKECVAVSINICPWQNPMRLGIKLKVTPLDTPGCIRYVNCVQQRSIPRSFTDAQFVQECIGFYYSSFCLANYNRAPHLYTAILFRINFTIQRMSYPS